MAIVVNCWNKHFATGRWVEAGVYYLVLRVEVPSTDAAIFSTHQNGHAACSLSEKTLDAILLVLMPFVLLKKFVLVVIEAQSAIQISEEKVLAVWGHLAKPNAWATATLRYHCLEACCLQHVPQSNVAIMRGRAYQCVIEGDINWTYWLRMAQNLEDRLVRPYIPKHQAIVSSTRE